MVQPTTPPANGFVTAMRKVYNPIGFSKGYNFVLFFIFAGALMGFILARFQYLSFNNVFCPAGGSGASGAAPGECYYYLNFDRYYYGIMIHLGTILPAGFLVVFQFVPVIRQKVLLYHRIAGYVIILLAVTSNVTAVVIADKAFGGHIETQAFIGFLAIIATFGIFNAYYNIKRLQIDQHRAWMIRVWFWMSSIITLRLIFFISASIITAWPTSFYNVWSCKKILFAMGGAEEDLYQSYPQCDPANANFTIDAQAVIKATMTGNVEQVGAALNLTFGMAGVLALALHAIGVEIYLALTPKEAERLRNVSYQRQLEAGFKNPGSAGFVPERIGDMDPWVPEHLRAGNSQERGANLDVTEVNSSASLK